MKAEHRKELHTNALAERMTRLVEGFRSGPKSTSVIVWTLCILIAGTVLAWYYFGGHGSNTGPLWVKLYQDTNLSELDTIYTQNPGTIPGRTARFQVARELLQRGLENLGSPNRIDGVKEPTKGRDAVLAARNEAPSRSDAIDDLAQARSNYAALYQECTDDPLLRQEAVLGIARAEEALVGVPQDQMPAGTPPGDLKKAIEAYETFLNPLATTDPEGALYKSLRKYVDNLKNNQKAVVEFYDRFNEEASKKK